MRRIGQIALLDGVIEHDPVDVVDDLGLVPEFDWPAQAAFGNRAGIAVVQADPPSRPVGGGPRDALPGCATIGVSR